jgi:hypothetical protein
MKRMNYNERQKFANLHESLRECKRRLPLPELWRRLGLPGEPKRSCQSPFREDRNPSFSVFQQGGFYFWRDHALGIGGDEVGFLTHRHQCDKHEAILAYHNLAGVPIPEKPGPVRAKSDRGRIVKIYDYRNAAGQLVHQTIRYEPKNFRQRRPAQKGMVQGGRKAWCDPHGSWWISTLQGIEPVLYNLPAILGAPPDVTIFLCEGEKDADAITECGGIATTAPMGAGKWRESYTEALRGRDVVIAADRDKAGEGHLQIVARELFGVAKRVRYIDWKKICPDLASDPSRKIDVSDFLAA